MCQEEEKEEEEDKVPKFLKLFQNLSDSRIQLFK